MLLVTVATENEIRPLNYFFSSSENSKILVTGMGPVATAASLSKHLALNGANIEGVMNIGVGGAYVSSGLSLLDICLARQEVFGDFGVCMENEILNFEPGLSQLSTPLLFNNELIAMSRDILTSHAVEYKVTNFVTVNCCSGTKKRGDYLWEKFDAGCENMEGAAVAMVCNAFNIPCVELRCISNLVEDRETANWKLEQAVARICSVAELILKECASAGYKPVIHNSQSD
jgi:futalosine hydrolase